MGEGGGPVEVDETYLGNRKDAPYARSAARRTSNAVLTLIDRKSEQARSFHIARFTIR